MDARKLTVHRREGGVPKQDRTKYIVQVVTCTYSNCTVTSWFAFRVLHPRADTLPQPPGEAQSQQTHLQRAGQGEEGRDCPGELPGQHSQRHHGHCHSAGGHPAVSGRGLYIGKYLPPPTREGEISADVIWGKNMKR